jgi:hypothetical protein
MGILAIRNGARTRRASPAAKQAGAYVAEALCAQRREANQRQQNTPLARVPIWGVSCGGGRSQDVWGAQLDGRPQRIARLLFRAILRTVGCLLVLLRELNVPHVAFVLNNALGSPLVFRSPGNRFLPKRLANAPAFPSGFAKQNTTKSLSCTFSAAHECGHLRLSSVMSHTTQPIGSATHFPLSGNTLGDGANSRPA